ncbi:MAG: acyltransferase [Caulobacteraceae bacterium]
MKPLVSIQYLRALAALAVAVYHASQWRPGHLIDVGRAGVDVFFVISGVIMWKVTGGMEHAPGVFVWRRFTRVAPLYWLVTLSLTGVALLWPDFLDNVHPDTGHVLLSLAFIPHMDPKGLPFPLYGPGWSLDYEAFFYLLFAAVLMAPRARQALLVCGCLAFVVVLGVLFGDPIYQLGANPMLLQFAAGVAIARLQESKALPGRRGGWLLVAFGLVGFAVSVVPGLFSELWRPFIWGAPAALLVAGALAVETDGGVARIPVLLVLGEASYALYLTHEPAQAIIGHTLGAENAWLFFPLALSATLAAGLACHWWIERPLTAWVRMLVRPERGEGGRTEPDRSPPSQSPAGTAS